MNSAENGTARLALPARRATISGGISNDPNLPQPSLDSDDDDMTMVAGTARLALPARRADSDDDDMTMVAANWSITHFSTRMRGMTLGHNRDCSNPVALRLAGVGWPCTIIAQ